ncbi:hypothetical protein RJ639_028948 [Escallonia herrerae]|uniref:Reverse transcriptase Ty1/copia-type domain-containing protein n=1 Tax=Escallonia herrerae TaxID=1293975 RepID=A0AA88X5E7_9ASTE|nr:hypothetical protein RJ639_028948 [Escallonia herrerae]
MPKEVWAEAVACAVYLSNRCHTKSVQGKTPQEAWSGFKPSVSHLRIFGSIAYAHVSNEKRSKLDDKSERYVFIGYDQSSKGYKLYNPSNGKIVISRDVEFDEESSWEWKIQNEDYNYNPFFDDEEEMMQPTTPPRTPPPQNPQVDEESSSEGPRRYRNLRDIYGATDEVTQNLSDMTQFCLFTDCEPFGYEDASRYKEWRVAMDDEIKAIKKNDTWELATLPKGKSTIGVKWVYKTKKNSKGEVERYKARLVAKGYKQKAGIDYGEVVIYHGTIVLGVVVEAFEGVGWGRGFGEW